jgi:hypothetical protein
VPIEAGERVWTDDGRKPLVVGIVSVPDGDSPYMGLLTVEASEIMVPRFMWDLNC